MGKFPLTNSTVTKLIIFLALMVCQNLSLGRLDFCKFSLDHGIFPVSSFQVFIFPNCCEKGWDRFTGSAGSTVSVEVYLQI